MTDVGNEDALSHPLVVPEEPSEPTIKYDKRENTTSIEIEQKEQSPLLGKALINTTYFFSDSLLESQFLLRRLKHLFYLSLCQSSFRMFHWSKKQLGISHLGTYRAIVRYSNQEGGLTFS